MVRANQTDEYDPEDFEMEFCDFPDYCECYNCQATKPFWR